MHRLRKKSDSKRGPALRLREERSQENRDIPVLSPSHFDTPPRQTQLSATESSSSASTIGPYLDLPPIADFRTSLILPDLTRRFSLLRQGDQVTFNDLKSRFAEQRAKGVEYSISEEEEDMLLDALGRLRPRGSQSPQKSQENSFNAQENGAAAQDTLSMSASSVSSRSGKRQSNNLFGSSRLRDYTYLKSVSSGQSKASSIRTASLTPTESSIAAARVTSIAESTSEASLRPLTPEGTISSGTMSSMQLSPSQIYLQPGSEIDDSVYGASSGSNVGFVVRDSGDDDSSVNRVGSSVSAVPTGSAIEYRLAKSMDPAALKRASLALQEAIKDMEDDEIVVLPRSTPIPRGAVDQSGHVSETQRDSIAYGAGVAFTADKQIHLAVDERRASPLPVRTLTGYVPGMPRPMTPRDYDFDDRSHSTTPRATSPIAISYTEVPASPSPAGLYRKESISASTVRQSPRPSTPANSSPLFLQRSPSGNGRQTPDEGSLAGTRKPDPIELESPTHSTLLSRRRPISPLSNLAAMGSGTGTASAGNSRPSTPSNVIWQPSLMASLKGSTNAHTRNDSWASTSSETGSEILLHTSEKQQKFSQRNIIKLPTLPDLGGMSISPSDRVQVKANGNGNGGGNGSGNRNGGDVFSSNRSQRSPTPTQKAPRSPSSPGFGNFGMDKNGSRRSSRQNAPSPWGFNTPYSLMLEPYSNPSRMSLDSDGSSYHSTEGDNKDWYEQILNGEESRPAWHDLNARRTESPISESRLEELSMKYFGMTLMDFAALQEKLLSVATARKRKNSTSVSNNRVASPSPQVVQAQGPSTPANTTSEQYNKKANALLYSVINDIQAKQPPPLDTTSSAVQATMASPTVPSPGTQRNRDLAHILFGDEEASRDNNKTTSAKPTKIESSPSVTTQSSSSVSSVSPVVPKQISVPTPGSQVHSIPAVVQSQPSTLSPPQSSYGLSRTPSARSMPKNDADLAKEIQQKTLAATAALKNGSKNNLPAEGLSHSASVSRKRIDTSKISEPLFMSSSTNVNAIPVRSASMSVGSSTNSGSLKIGSRFRKLRGTLRSKNPPAEEKNLSRTESMKSPAESSQTVEFEPSRTPALASATETGRFKVSVPSPPASAGPGLKGFISRFRGKQRATETPTPPSSESREPSQLLPRVTPLSPLAQDSFNQKTPTNDKAFVPQMVKPERKISLRKQATASSSASSNTRPISPAVAPPTAAPAAPAGSHQSILIQQLFDAANNLGLDQQALNDLLVRSGSVNTKTVNKVAKSNSQAARSNSRLGQRSETPISIEQTNSGHSTIQLPSPTSRPSPSAEVDGSTKPLNLRPDNGRRGGENRGDNVAKTIVRRTIILPQDSKIPGNGNDGPNQTQNQNQNVHRSSSSKRNRRGSVNSTSIRDRAPTPPPPRSPIGQRFSNDGSPPVPSLPHGLGISEAHLFVPPPIEKSNSNYDSLYDMYGNEHRPQGSSSNSPVQGLELIEYANGDTIWSIVNSLRDDDVDSVYTTGRASVASQYSTREAGQDKDGMQVFFKERTRSTRNSYSSFALKQRQAEEAQAQAQAKGRPETKVFYSSTEQIGRLLNNLSQGMDAGSFNFSPTRPSHGHSTSSSISTNDTMNWTVDERLEHMLSSLNRNT